MGELKNKTAIISGGGTGIGLAAAKRFYAEEADVVIAGRREAILQTAAEEIENRTAAEGEKKTLRTNRIVYKVTDVTDEADIQELVRYTMTRFGRIDVLVNAAGIMLFESVEKSTFEFWERLFSVNMFGTARLSAAVLPHMRGNKKGSIINISSISGLRGSAGGSAYCASKGAVIRFTEAAALETASEGIRVNCIAPGLVENTELGREMFSEEEALQAYKRFRSLHPLGRNGTPGDVAELALFLAGEKSSWITGSTFPIDGGRHVTMNG